MPRTHRSTLIVSLLALVVFAPPAIGAGLEPERVYYGLNRPIPVTVDAGETEGATLEVALYEPGQSEPVETAPVESGAVDLFEAFPIIWNRSLPVTLYAQLRAGGRDVGAPLVIQPMRTPRQASWEPSEREVVWDDGRRRPLSGMRVYKKRNLRFETSHGAFTVRLRPEFAPNTCYHIMGLVEDGFYTDIPFHRIIPKDQNGNPFVIQFGDPIGTGSGGPGFYVDLEPSELPHAFGVVSMARTFDNPNSNGSQMFICLSRAATGRLDGDYTSFGEIVDGLDTILAIEGAPLDDERRGEPSDPVPTIERARLVDAPPLDQQPRRIKRPAPEPETQR